MSTPWSVAHALAAHGHMRAMKDLDVWVHSDPANATRVIRALRNFCAPLHDLTEADLCAQDTVFQIGVPPVRIDVLTSVTGVHFADAWEDRKSARFAIQPVFVLSKRCLIQNKRAAGRKQDLQM